MSAGAGRPLEGLTVVVTRSEEGSGELGRLLEEAGAILLAFPTIRHEPALLAEPARRTLSDLGSFSHAVVASPAAARYLSRALGELRLGPDALERVRVAAVGRATARALEEAGLRAAIVSRGRSGKDLAAEMVEREGVGPGSRVLLPRSDLALRDIETALEEAGARVEPVVLYRTVTEARGKAKPFLDAIAAGSPPLAITFTSPSTFRGFLELAGEAGRGALASGATRIVTIGPTTSAAIREAGLEPAAEALDPSPEGLAAAVVSIRPARR